MDAPDKTHRLLRTITVLDLVILLGNVCRGLADRRIGHEDTLIPANKLIHRLNKRYKAWVTDIESALWSCNMLDEKGKFWHPHNVPFKRWVSLMLPYDKFDAQYNLLERKPHNNVKSTESSDGCG